VMKDGVEQRVNAASLVRFFFFFRLNNVRRRVQIATTPHIGFSSFVPSIYFF
jgi:hypothetical protein